MKNRKEVEKEAVELIVLRDRAGLPNWSIDSDRGTGRNEQLLAEPQPALQLLEPQHRHFNY